MTKQSIQVPLNRVEGDLEISVEVENGVVTEARSSGLMYRGFENILRGRGALDGLVITPRICGICTTGHLTAAVRALDSLYGVSIPPAATLVRNLALMVEHIQSDIRHGVLMFAADFTNRAYRDQHRFDEAVLRYAPLKGKLAVDTIRETKKVLEIVAILGGQWPHSSFMVPGGIASVPDASEIIQCRYLLADYRRWYEKTILGCSLERWQSVRSRSDLEIWLEESDSHREGHLGFFIDFCRRNGLNKTGRGCGKFISFGSLDIPSGSAVRGPRNGQQLVPAGYVELGGVADFDQMKVAEYIDSSYYHGYEGGRHPLEGITLPQVPSGDNCKYSWSKAPRYDGRPAETGPLAELAVAGHPLLSELLSEEGPNTFVREFARLIRPAEILPVMETWFEELIGESVYYSSPGEIPDGEGIGLTHASRGALGHWVRIRNGKIDHYQIITPTAWNGSPRGGDGKRGPWEEALVGLSIRDIANPVELGHVVRSFDACLVCTVHMLRRGKEFRRISMGDVA